MSICLPSKLPSLSSACTFNPSHSHSRSHPVPIHQSRPSNPISSIQFISFIPIQYHTILRNTVISQVLTGSGALWEHMLHTGLGSYSGGGIGGSGGVGDSGSVGGGGGVDGSGGAFGLEAVLHVSAIGLFSLMLLVCVLGAVDVPVKDVPVKDISVRDVSVKDVSVKDVSVRPTAQGWVRNVAGSVLIAYPLVVLAWIGWYLRANPLVWVFQLVVYTETALEWCLIWVISITATSSFALFALRHLGWSRITCRKLFHLLATCMFVPPLFQGLGAFVSLAVGVALCVMVSDPGLKHTC